MTRRASVGGPPRGDVRVGTCGWAYDHWRGRLYPPALPREAWLRAYATCFRAVEVDATFYGLPSPEAVAAWRDAVPAGFVFAVKLSRYLTHMRKLRAPEDPLRTFFGRVDRLGAMLGPVLVQLPPRWHLDLERLERFLAALPPGRRFVFEFRDPTWFDPRVYDLLRAHGAGFCSYDLVGRPCPRVRTADFVYVRLHGTEARFGGGYPTPQLCGWAGAASTWSRLGHDVYVFFDNDADAHAPADAAALQRMLGAGPAAGASALAGAGSAAAGASALAAAGSAAAAAPSGPSAPR